MTAHLGTVLFASGAAMLLSGAWFSIVEHDEATANSCTAWGIILWIISGWTS